MTIYSLPDELLVAIVAAGKKVQWTLSHVSRRLRAVVGTSTLWTLIVTILDAEGSVEILKLYLQRSQECNISATWHNPSPHKRSALLTERLGRHIVPYVKRLWIILNVDGAAEHLEVGNDCYYNGVVQLFSAGAPRLSFLKMERHASEEHLLMASTIAAQCPPLFHLHLEIPQDPLQFFAIVDLFDSPALTEFVIDGAHGDQIFALWGLASLPHASFPALTSLTLIGNSACDCDSETVLPVTNANFPPVAHFPPIFPALSSRALFDQCSTPVFVKDILRRGDGCS
ncbi:hypothetical protein K438DRAFT_1959768 [Mycena galopus ATCC 62051]|nr:hypothetical protein K438DRAFT_1959768 [Mycena galopus ATCC 62051]